MFCHYLQNHAFLDACDKLGIMVEPALVGWQYTAGYTNATFTANLKRDLRTLLHYYRNHPSVVCWESAMNESNPPAAWLDTRECDRSRGNSQSPRVYDRGSRAPAAGRRRIFLISTRQRCSSAAGPRRRRPRPMAFRSIGHWEYGGFTSTSMQTRANLDAGLLIQAGKPLRRR